MLSESHSQGYFVAKRIWVLLGLMICVMAYSGVTVQGQTIFGRISGTVKDSNGSAIPSATVTITNAATNLVRTATTDEDGFYTATNLPVGTYTILVARDGFKRAQQAGVVLAADARLTQDMTLEVGQVTETVEVSSGVGETVNTTSGEVARVVDQRQVQNLALNGRNYMQLVTLIPGAVILDEDQLALTTSLSISQASVNGNRPNYNSLSVDGGFNMDSGSNNSQVNNVGIDFVQEVKIETSNFSAEYGRNAGAAINIVTRGGGNTFHGAAFEFLRNDKLDARNFFSPVRAKLRFNDFGWNFNGPIKKDKLFFFGGQEYKRIRQDTAPVKRSLPTSAERLGDFSARSGTLNVPTGYTAINPATGATVAAGQPIPNRNLANLRLNGAPVTLSPDGKAIAAVYSAMQKLAVAYADTPTANNATFQQPGPFDWREDNLRIDYRFNEKHSIYGRYFHDYYNLIDPYGTFINSQLPTIPSNRLRPGYSAQVSYTWLIHPTLINEAKINSTWNSQHIPPVGDVWKRESYGFAFTQLFSSGGIYDNGIPNVTFAGGAAYSNFSGPAASLVSPTVDIAMSDNLTIIHGKHSIKTGALIIRNRKDQNGRSGYTGNLAFNTNRPGTTGNAFADALLGNFRTYNEADNDPMGFFRFSQYEAYATDSWKVTRNFSLEIGARFYHYGPTYTQANNMTNFDPSRYDPSQAVTILSNGNIDPTKGGNRFNGLVRAGSGIPPSEVGRVSTSAASLALVPAGAPRGFYNPASKLAPRFGFAYDPWGDGKTSIRGGFGMFYDKVEGNLIFGQINLPPFINTPQFENGNLSNISGGTPSALAPLAGISAIDPNLKVAYSMNYSAGIQRELPHGFFVEATYVGNQGRHLIRQPDLNAIPFDALVANQPPGPNANLNTLRKYKGYTAINYRLSDATSTYNGLQLYGVKRKGDLELTAAYTWSRNLTDTSGNGDGLDVGEDPFNRHYNYGPATFDRRHIFVATYDYHIPFLRSKKGVEGAILSGWEVSGITRFQSGAPFTPTGGTAIGTRRADYVGGPVLLSNPGPDGWINPAAFAPAPLGRRGNAPVGIVHGPNLQTWDFSMRKQFRLSERFNLRFQADMFNAFNRANFRAPDVAFGTCTVTTTSQCAPSNGAFGKIGTAGPGRNIQFGLRLDF